MLAKIIYRILLIAIVAVVIFWMGVSMLRIMDFWDTAGALLMGLTFMLATMLYRNHPKQWIMWLGFGLWSALAYIALLTSAYLSHPDYKNIPLWAQAANPYIYASLPFVLLWCVRMLLPLYW